MQLQNEANLLQIKANIRHTEATDMWNYYQAKNIKDNEDQIALKQERFLPKDFGNQEERDQAKKEWSNHVNKYKVELPKHKAEAEDLVEKGKDFQKEAEEKLKKSEQAHYRGDRFDLAELGVELALVLCSVAVLTKQRGFWLGGIGIGLVGAVVAVSAFFMP